MPVFQPEDQWLLGDEDVEHFDHLSEHPLACASQPRILFVQAKVLEVEFVVIHHEAPPARRPRNFTKLLDLLQESLSWKHYISFIRTTVEQANRTT